MDEGVKAAPKTDARSLKIMSKKKQNIMRISWSKLRDTAKLALQSDAHAQFALSNLKHYLRPNK